MKYLSMLAYAAILLSCYGWGQILAGRALAGERNRFAFLSVAGLAGLIAIGGLLNAVHLAYPSALWALLLIGLALAGFHLLRGFRPGLALPGLRELPRILPMLLLLAAVAFYAFTLLPSTQFNISDDLHTYVPRPLRMLETGTLGGNPFGLLGMDSLGGQAFLQGFILLGFPVEYLLGFDAVFGFALTGLLLLEVSRRYVLHWSVTSLAMFAFIAISPQSVNISVIYLGSALMLGMIYAGLLLVERLPANAGQAGRFAIVLGLLFAGLVSLKVTLVSYCMAYLGIFLLGLLWLWPQRKEALKIAGTTLFTSIAALLPWLLLHMPLYLKALSGASTPLPEQAEGFALPKGNMLGLLSTADLNYGGSFLAYGLLAVALCGAALYAISKFLSGRYAPDQRGYYLVVFAACGAGVASYLFNGQMFPAALSIRYSCPALIATFPFAMMAVTSRLARPANILTGTLFLVAGRGLVWSMLVLTVVLFGDSFAARVERARTVHGTLSFPVHDTYIRYDRFAISPAAGEIIRGIQDKTLPDTKILAWISMPQHLDFARNDIYTVMGPGLLNPWLDMPLTGKVADMASYLKGEGIRYILWEYDGYGITKRERLREMLSHDFAVDRRIGQRGLYLVKMLDVMMAGGRFLHHSNGMVLFDLQQLL